MPVTFKSIPYWVRPLLWLRPLRISADVENGRVTVVRAKKLFGILYILSVDSGKRACHYCGYCEY